MNDMTLFLDLILIASGAYCMYTFLRLAVTKRLFKNGLLVPKETARTSRCTSAI